MYVPVYLMICDMTAKSNKDYIIKNEKHNMKANNNLID